MLHEAVTNDSVWPCCKWHVWSVEISAKLRRHLASVLPSHPLFSALRMQAHTCIRLSLKRKCMHIQFETVWVIFCVLSFLCFPNFARALSETCYISWMHVSSSLSFFITISSRCRFWRLRHASMNASSSSRQPSLGYVLLAPPQIHSRWNLSHCSSLCLPSSSCHFLFFWTSDFHLGNLNLPGRVICWHHHGHHKAWLPLLVFY